MTERIDHARIAQENLNVVGSRPMLPEVAAVTATAALVHATLALAEQQRIANLIDIYVTEGSAESGFIAKGFDFGYMADQIREGLGL